eukprot:GGOE01014331.1.p1 GENE.GGOE01014331.1~~GGOE01014331.1.p1  ORF type:complete len:809 (+),score=153.75 GGOE01014331.1:18-2444(+)
MASPPVSPLLASSASASPTSSLEGGSSKSLKGILHKRSKKEELQYFVSKDGLNLAFPTRGKKEIIPSTHWVDLDAHIRQHLDTQMVVIHIEGATGLLPPRGCKRASPCLRVRRSFFSQKTGVKARTLNPVWKERLYFLLEPGMTLYFDILDNELDGIMTEGAVMGRGEVLFDESTVQRLRSGRVSVTLPLQQCGKPAGQLSLMLEVNTAKALDPSQLSDEFRDVTENAKELQEHHLEPTIRQLRVKLKESSIPSFVGPPCDTYLRIGCGLFNVQTDIQMLSLTPTWDEDFVIPVPERTIGTNRLPRALQYDTLEIELWHLMTMKADALISHLSIPLPDILGYGGHQVDADSPPWRVYGMPLVNREQVKQRMREAFHSSHSHSAEIMDSTITAAIFFDTSYDAERYSDCGKITIQLEKLQLQQAMEEVHVVVKSERHWTKYRANPVDRTLQIKVRRPRMLITIAITSPVPNSLRQRERILGVIHLRASMLVPHRWTEVQYPLLTRGKAQCFQHGTLDIRLLWEAVPFPKLLGQYSTPSLPTRHYSHPWTAKQTSHFNCTKMNIIITYLEHQPKPIRREVVRAVLAQDFNKFEWALMKAHMRRSSRAFHQIRDLALLVKAVMYWENKHVSLLANAAWLAFSFFPREVSTATMAIGIVCIVLHNLRTPLDSRLAMPDPSLFGGIAQDDSDEEESHERKVHNPIKYLTTKIEHFEESATRSQVLAQTIASGFESILSAFTMTDYIISNVAIMVMLLLTLALWVLPFSVIVAVAGLVVLRHPRFRRPSPSRALCLLSHLPNRLDTVLYAKGTA